MSNHIKTSKLISYLLRHNPAKKGLVLDSNGFGDNICQEIQ